MKNIQPFIDLGWYTVPLKGKLERLESGKKTTPIYEKNWKEIYSSTFNEKPTDIGLVLTGSLSDIIAIDCDNQNTYEIFKSLEDPSYEWVINSIGKPKGGGTLIYKYEEGLDTFSIQNKNINLDFYSDHGAIYLPTDANKTKDPLKYEDFKDLPEIKKLPAAARALLHNLQDHYVLGKGVQNTSTITESVNICANYLAPQIEALVKDKDFSPSLFKMITPKSFRSISQYVKFGYLHPNKVPDGRGSEYLSKVAAILGADPSIDKEMFSQAIKIINSMWSQPMPTTRLEATIINRMISGEANINGEPIWKYDENWKTHGLTFSSKIGDSIELFFDDVRSIYYLVNYTRLKAMQFYSDNDLTSYVEAISLGGLSKKKIKNRIPIVRAKINPALPFGFYKKDDYTREFNLYMQSSGLAILNEPDSFKDYYEYPTTIIKFLHTLIPDDLMRNYILGFLKRKLTSFKYSPVVPYFLGASGSGKDTFVSIIEAILGEQYIARPTSKEFLEQYNGYLLDKYVIQLDEYGNQLATTVAKQEAIGKIKAYTGKDTIQVRQMRNDGFPYNHSITFILTANTNPLMLEDGDRRIALIETPNILKNADWVQEAGGMSVVHDKIFTEIDDFCYYLATEVNNISWDEYAYPPETKMKDDLIASVMPAAQRIAYYCSKSMFDQLHDLAIEFDCINVFDNSNHGRIFEDDLFELYITMTDGNGTKQGLSKYMKQFNFDKVPTTKDGAKAYYYHIPSLMAFTKNTHLVDYSNEENSYE